MALIDVIAVLEVLESYATPSSINVVFSGHTFYVRDV